MKIKYALLLTLAGGRPPLAPDRTHGPALSSAGQNREIAARLAASGDTARKPQRGWWRWRRRLRGRPGA
jgi:hypothetical protein